MNRSIIGQHQKKPKKSQKINRYDEAKNDELLEIVAADLIIPENRVNRD